MEKIDLKNLGPTDFEGLILKLGWEPYRAGQIMSWIYQKRVAEIDSMTNLAYSMRAALKKLAFLSSLKPGQVLVSADGTRKYLFALEDGGVIESVLIPEKGHFTPLENLHAEARGEAKDTHSLPHRVTAQGERLLTGCTLCVSTQLGCALKCRFCYTGKRGLARNLTTAEIVGQVEAVLTDLEGKGILKNIVLMGMGEPLHNYENTVKALEIIFHPQGFDFSHRRVTLSTAGLIPELKRLGKKSPVNLAISLNAADNETRSFLMPINRKHPLAELLAVLRDYPLPHRKRITFEYILIAGVNDALRDAEKLVDLLRPLRCKINLIPFNAHPGVTFKRPEKKKIAAFRDVLVSHGYTAIVRESRGDDILAACGQLGGTHG
jgi:23S rRNA (adenine2503-C2)-methyltransferase